MTTTGIPAPRDHTATPHPEDLGPVRTEIMVSTADLRQALRSVAVHADQDKDSPVLQRIRFAIRGGNALVTATNRYTAGLAAVSVWDNTYDDDNTDLDLHPGQISEILAMFKSSGESSDDAGDDDLRIRLTDRYVTMTDTAGLFPGKEVTWPRLATEDQFPDIPALVAGMLASAGSSNAAALHTSGKLLGLFKTASTVYDKPVVIEPTSAKHGALVLSVGESFLGLLMPLKPSEEQLAEQQEWRRGWERRLVNVATGELPTAAR